MTQESQENQHSNHIFVNCWKCKKDFDITEAEKCYECLNGDYQSTQLALAIGEAHFTTKCSHCGACICHKYNKMKPIKCETLNKVGIMAVMPSVKEMLEKSKRL